VKVTVADRPLTETDAGLAAVFMFEGEALPDELAAARGAADVNGGYRKREVIHPDSPERVVAVGLGDRSDFSPERARVAAAIAAKTAAAHKASSLALVQPDAGDSEAVAAALVEGAILASYRFDRFKSSKDDGDDSPPGLEEITLVSGADVAAAAEVARVATEAANRARELQDLPSNFVTPSYLAERALELAEGLNDRRTAADVYFQASIIADREGHWVLARSYAERAKVAYEELSDRGNLGRLLNNLGGINFLLGHPAEAIGFLKDAVRIALEVGDDAEAAHAVNGIAQVHLRTGDVSLAEEQARYALELLGDRVDELAEIGNAQLVLGRSLLEQDRLDEAEEAFRAGEEAYGQLSSASHRASAWVAQGDLAARRGDDSTAARLYRQAADALQDVRF
jgi:tetratricopeptide (TPR) repeat protein